MTCVSFAKVDQVKKNKTLKNTGKMEKNTGKVGEFCQSRKVGTMVSVFILNATLVFLRDDNKNKRTLHFA